MKVFNEDHRIGRGHVKAIVEALETGDNLSIKEHFIGYRELLSGHIKREDEVLGLTCRFVRPNWYPL